MAAAMNIISKANETVLTILGKEKSAQGSWRLTHFCVEKQVPDGILLFHTLTKELVLLTKEEYSRLTQLDYLKSHWFVVPEALQDKEYADLVKLILSAQLRKPTPITNYTIFTTTDCNARCFYCFELGRSRIPMSNDTALKVVEYIKSHCGGQKVRLDWFGGEPLFNAGVIDTICQGLKAANIEFTSKMVSNGYLFDDETVTKAAESWKLKQVQISLDGTETVYNKAKAYIYKNVNPYQIVLDNIGRLLDANIMVRIRLNIDLYNAENLLELVDELARRFRGRQGLYIYAHHLFDINMPAAQLHDQQQWQQRGDAMAQLNERICQSGFSLLQGINKKLVLNHCMADSRDSITITPDGHIGLCEHFSEDGFIGHIEKEGFDENLRAQWREIMPEIEECATCFHYPACIRLKKCTNESLCFPQLRQEYLWKNQVQMENEYNNWKKTHDEQ